MNERESSEKEYGGLEDLEARLTGYYGPHVAEQPLPSESWLHVRSRLRRRSGSLGLRVRRWQCSTHARAAWRRVSPRHWVRKWHHRGTSSATATPAFVQGAFQRILSRADVSSPTARLRCAFKADGSVPAVQTPWLFSHTIRLVLPLYCLLSQSLEPAELDVLLASGLARSLYLRKPAYFLLHFLLASSVLLVWLTSVLLWQQGFSALVFPLALVCSAAIVWAMHVQRRRLAFRADARIVLWLGRANVCQGLHLLADASRRPKQKRWGEPSLAERIERICGARVTVNGQVPNPLKGTGLHLDSTAILPSRKENSFGFTARCIKGN